MYVYVSKHLWCHLCVRFCATDDSSNLFFVFVQPKINFDFASDCQVQRSIPGNSWSYVSRLQDLRR